MKGSLDREHHTYEGRLIGHEPSRWQYVHGCRHPDCVKASAAYHAESIRRRAARLLADPALTTHGTDNAYKNWGCRCKECKHAHHLVMVAPHQLAIKQKSYDKKRPGASERRVRRNERQRTA